MTQEILDGGEIGIAIEELGGHGRSKMVIGALELGLTGIGFHVPLNTTDRNGLPLIRTLVRQKNFSRSGRRPHFQIGGQGLKGIINLKKIFL